MWTILKHLPADQAVKLVLTSAPFVSFRTAATSEVIRFDLSFSLCNVQIVSANVTILSSRLAKMLKNRILWIFQSCNWGTFKINHYCDCNKKSPIYLISCKVCSEEHVGSTTDRLRFWWNNYKSFQRKAERGEDSAQKYLHEHFLSEGHNGLINDVEIWRL